jgi:uroporphyrinogen-III decarboxylase
MLWQLDEKEVMTPDDYDTIINNGWNSFRADYLPNRVNYDMQKTLKDLEYAGQATKNIEDAGYVVYAPVVHTLVNEALSGGRSMAKFMRDLYKMPDKVEATLEVIQKEEMEVLRQQIRAAKPLTVFVSPSRGASEFFAPKLWERFVWKYMKEVGDIIIEEGSIVNFHCDGNWERDLEYFNEFPKGKCVFESDGITDIYKLKEKIGDTVCIKGDVPSGTMVLGTPDEVYEYSSKLIKEPALSFQTDAPCLPMPKAKI